MKTNYLLLFLFVIFSQNLSAQKHKIAGTYKGQAAQGMAIYGDNAYILNNTGYCRVYNLNSKKVIQEFPLASTNSRNHANCATFGIEHYGNNPIPVLYVSESNSPYRCFVENMENGKSELVQTIQVIEDGMPKATHDWIVDSDKGFLYTFTRLGTKDEDGNIRHSIIKYRLPKLSEGKDVKLTKDDVIDQFEVGFLSMGQGGTIKGKYLYLPVGLPKSYDSTRDDSKRLVIIVNLKKKKIKKIVNLSSMLSDEPEDISFYGSELLLFCGQKGGLWSINLNKTDNILDQIGNQLLQLFGGGTTGKS